MNKGYQIKNFSNTIKDVDTKNGIITGYFAIFDNIDADGDMFIKGAFKKTISERGVNGSNRIYHLLQHSMWEPLGKPSVLKEDSKGLYFETKISKTSYGIDTIQLYADEVYNEHSVGFRTIKEERNSDDDVPNEIKEVKLYEGSTVTLGANSETFFVGFKEDELKNRMSIIQKSLKNGNLRDETCELLEIQIELLKSLIQTQPSSDTELLKAFRSQFSFL